MPAYKVDVSGRSYRVDAPDEDTAWAWANDYHEEDRPVLKAPEAPEGNIVNAIKGIGTQLEGLVPKTKYMLEDAAAGVSWRGKPIIESLVSGATSRLGIPNEQKLFDPGDPRGRSTAEREASEAGFREQLTTPEFKGMIPRAAYGAASSMLQTLPGIAASVITRNPDPAIANIAAITAPQAYSKYRLDRGATREQALQGTALETGIEVGTEMLPMSVVANSLGKVGMGHFLADFLGKELPGELIATITQNAVDTSIANPDKTWGQYLKELPGQLGETALATAMTAGTYAGAGKVMSSLAGSQPAAPTPPPGATAAPPPPPTPGAPAAAAPPPPPGAPPLRTVTIGTIPPQETWEVDEETGNQIEPPPTPTRIDILSEPDEDDLQTIRYPDGSVVQAPASGIESRLIPEAEAPVVPTEAELPAATPVEPEPTFFGGPRITDDTDITDVTEPPTPPPKKIKKVFTSDFLDDDKVATAPPAVEAEPATQPVRDNRLEEKYGTEISRVRVDDLDMLGSDWLSNKQRSAKKAQVVAEKAGYAPSAPRGPITGSTERPMLMDPVKVSQLPGAMKEDPKPGNPKYDALMKSMSKKGYDPEQGGPIVVGVSHQGTPYIIEGNNRAAVARDLRLPAIPVEVRWYAGGERVPGALSPDKLSDYVYSPQNITPAPTTAVAPAPTTAVAPVAAAPVAAPALPAALAVAKPRHIGHPVDWTGRDVERAAYIATSDVTPAAKGRFVEWLSQNNIPADQVASIGTQVRSNLDQASAAAPKPTAPLKAPAVFGVSAPAAPAVTIKATPKVPPQVAAAVKSKKGSPLQVLSQIFKQNAPVETKEAEQTEGGQGPMAETIRSKPGVNARRMAKMLGPQLYGDPTDMGSVSIKEVLQNSFDAIKGAMSQGLIQKGRISIKTSKDGHTIEMTDNGSGMTPQLLGGKFLEIAGTGKESENASGGFGIAKMLFLYGNEFLRVITMRDGKVSELKTSGTQLFDSLEDENSAPDIEVREPNKADRIMFPDGHGTYILITTPKEFDDPTTGKKKEIEPVKSEYNVPALGLSPLFADIDVDFNGSTVYGIGSNFRSEDYTSFVKVKFPWGTADVYVEKEPNSSPWSKNTHVLSNGLWQFSSALKKNPKDIYGENIPRTFYVDIHPSVKPEEPGYPFNFNRQSLTEQAKEDYDKIINYINAIYSIDSLGNEAKSFGEIKYFDNNGELGKGIDLTPDIPVVDTDFSRIKAGDKVEVKDGRLIVNGKQLPELTPEQLSAGIPSTADLKMKSSLIKSNRVMAHDNLEIEQPDGTYIPFSDYMRAKFSDRFDQYAFMVGDAFKTLRDEVASLMDYQDLMKEAVGVSFDETYRGVNIRIPFHGMFINPAVPEDSDPITAGFGMVGTMIHELAHHRVRSHNEKFPAEMARIQNKLKGADVAGGFPFSWFENNVALQTKEFADVLAEAQRVYEDENIRPRGNRFTESSYESIPREADEGEPSGDNGDGRAGGAGQRLLSQSAQSTGSTGRRSTSGVGGIGATQAGNVGQQNNALNAQSIATHVAIMKPMLDFLDKKFGTKFAEAKPFDKQGLAALNSTLPPDQQLSRMPESRNVSQALSDFVARTSGSLQVFIKRHIDPVKKAIIEASKANVDPQEIGMYLWARSTPARNLIVAKNNPEFKGAGSGLTNAEAQAIIDDFMRQGKLPTLMRVAKVHDALVDLMLKMRVDNGLMTAAEATALRADQPFYTPLKGWALDGDMQVSGDENPHLGFEELRRSRKGISPREYIRAQGRKTAPLNPIFNLTTDAQNLVLRIEKNRAMLPLLNNLLADPIGNADIAKVYTDKKPKRVPGEIDKKTGKRKFKTVNMRGDPSFTVIKKGGLNHYIEFNKDTDAGAAMSRAFANMSPATLNKFHKGYRAFTAGIKGLMTRFSPDHIFRVAGMRDFMDSIVTAYASETMPGGAAEGKKVAENTVKYAFSPSTWGAAWRFAGGKDAPTGSQQAQILDLFETMAQDGGSDGHSMIEDAVAQVKDIQKITSRLRGESKKGPVIATKAGLQMVGDFMTRVMDLMNTVFRFATYRAALEAKVSPADAARLARQATVDLTRKGEWTGMLDDLYFFANPAVQSTIKQGQLLKSRNGRRAMAAFVTFGALTAMWNAMMGGGDDDDDGISNYDQLNDIEKMTNLVIYFGPKKDDYVKVPFGFLVAFPAFTGQKLAEVAMGTTKPESAAVSLMETAFQIGKGALQTFSPVKVSASEAADIPSSLTPSILQPLLGLLRNKDYWGKNIYNVPSQYDEKAKSSMGRETTGAGYKWFAKFMNDMSGGAGNVNGWFDFQPEGYRYWVNTLGGGPVRTLRNVANLANKDDADVRDIPVIKGWLGSGGEYDAQNSYYENTSKLAAISKAEEDDSEEDWATKERKFPVQTDANIIDAYKDAEKYLRQYYKDLDDALDGVTDAAERRKILDEMKSDKDEIYSEFNGTYNDTKRDMVGSRREVKAK